MTNIATGSMAPEFSLKDQDGKTHTLKDFAGNWLVVYFYPKDDTPGCTKEACSFRDSFTELLKNNIKVVGISKDSVTSHKKFADKYSLTFPLLADEDKSVQKAYGAWGAKTFMGRTFEGTLRQTFLIDPQGVIRKIYPKVVPLDHASQILNDFAKLT